MKLIQNVCDRLGLSHQQLSVLIGASRSLITKAASGQRQLPHQPMLVLAKMHAALQKVPAEKNRSYAATAAEQKEIKDRLLTCRHTVEKLQRKLTAMKEKYRAGHYLQQTLAALAASGEKFSKRQKNWVEELQYQAEKKLADGNLLNQRKLSIQITLLLKEIELWERVPNPLVK